MQSLDNYLALEQFSRNHAFSYQIEVAPELDPEEVWIPPMMIQPFVENAIIHGVAHLADRLGEIKINFSRKQQYLRCVVTDNGIGREAAQKIKSQQEAQHKSTALQVTRERLELLALDPTAPQSLRIEDVVSSEEQVIGTQVIMFLPFQTTLSQK